MSSPEKTKKQLAAKITIKGITDSQKKSLFKGKTPTKKQVEALPKDNLKKLYKAALKLESVEQQQRMKASGKPIKRKNLNLLHKDAKKLIEVQLLKKELHATLVAINTLALNLYKHSGAVGFYCRLNKPCMKSAYEALPWCGAKKIDIQAVLVAMFKPVCTTHNQQLFPCYYYSMFDVPLQKLRAIKNRIHFMQK